LTGNKATAIKDEEMRITYIIYFCLLILVACNNKPVKDPIEFKYEIIKIDGCEYFQYKAGQGYKHISHKGDFKNPIHCYNQINQ